MTKRFEFEPMTGGLGATVLGVDLAADLNKEQLQSLRSGMHEHGVLFFKDQKLSEEDHVRFAERWGQIDINRFFRAVPGYPMIAEVRKDPDQKTNIGGGWHADHSYDEAPAMGSILYALEVPESGGDTLFANMATAYESLSDGLKSVLKDLRAVHSSRHVFGGGRHYQQSDAGGRVGNADAAVQDVIHPVVLKHPESGAEVLYVNPAFTLHFEGWTAEESAPLLKFLYQHAVRPEFTCRFKWQSGSLAFWDNRSTWHYAVNDYHGQRRVMHRITVAGVPLS